MWVFTRIGFYSAVCGRRKTADGYTGPINKHVIVVRARCRDHLQALLENHRLFFDAEIIDTPDRDYPHRIVTDDVTWGMFLTAVAAEMDYDNFKRKAAQMSHDPSYDYYSRLHEVWDVMHHTTTNIDAGLKAVQQIQDTIDDAKQ